MVKPAMAQLNQAEVVPEERARQKEQERRDNPKPRRWVVMASGAGALLLCLITYLLHLDRTVGMYVDDAWYVLLAKALATGQSYTLINSPSQGILPLYPPAFPWLLSLIYRLAPQFPENVWLLKSISIAAMLAVGITAYFYFVRDRKLPPYVALGICVATVISPPLIFFATSTVMSECVFTLVQLLTIVVIERCVHAGKRVRAWHYALLGSALASFAFLTRSIAVVLIAGAFVYLLKERLFRAALIFAAGVVLFVGPWTLYARLHAPTAEQRMEHGSYIVQGYTTQFWQKEAAEASSGIISVKELPGRIGMNIVRVLRSEVGAVFVGPLTQFLKQLNARGGEGFSFILSMLAITGFISVARERITLAEIVVPLSMMIIVVWPWSEGWSRGTTTIVRSVGTCVPARRAVSSMSTTAPRRRNPSAVTRALASASTRRTATASAPKPENRGRKTAPSLATAMTAATTSGTIGQKMPTVSPRPIPRRSSRSAIPSVSARRSA